jgi:digeranylgeranylglycerophospholipid reductase
VPKAVVSRTRLDCEVAVVGGGPAGLATARETAAAGLKTVVFERDHAIGEPVRTSGGSFVKPLVALGIPRRCWHEVHRIRVVGPAVQAVKNYRRPFGCVLDIRATYQWLAEQAVDAGAEIRLKSHVGRAIEVGGRPAGVEVRDALLGPLDVRSDVVVDASGHTGFLARAAGMRPANERAAVGLELELHAPRWNQDEAAFWLGDHVAPGGYGWAFPLGGDRLRLGIGLVRPESRAEPRDLLQVLRQLVEREIGAGATTGPIEQHSGLMPVLDPRQVRLTAPGLVVVGDAAGQGSTLLGEGIRYAIAAGRMAGRAIAASRADPRALSSYDDQWRRATQRDLRLAHAVNTRICSFRDEDWDRAIRRLDALTPRQAGAVFATSFSPGWAMGVALSHPGLIRSLARAGVAERRARRQAAMDRSRSNLAT